MNRVLIPKTDKFKFFISPSPAWIKKDNEVFLRCGKCRKLSSLRTHTIDSEGMVEPSIYCDPDKCGWHVFGQLLDWKS